MAWQEAWQEVQLCDPISGPTATFCWYREWQVACTLCTSLTGSPDQLTGASGLPTTEAHSALPGGEAQSPEGTHGNLCSRGWAVATCSSKGMIKTSHKMAGSLFNT